MSPAGEVALVEWCQKFKQAVTEAEYPLPKVGKGPATDTPRLAQTGQTTRPES